MALPKLVRVLVNPKTPRGVYIIGGVRIVSASDDETLGRELRTVEVTCGSMEEADRLREVVRETEGLEYERDSRP